MRTTYLPLLMKTHILISIPHLVSTHYWKRHTTLHYLYPAPLNINFVDSLDTYMYMILSVIYMHSVMCRCCWDTKQKSCQAVHWATRQSERTLCQIVFYWSTACRKDFGSSSSYRSDQAHISWWDLTEYWYRHSTHSTITSSNQTIISITVWRMA